MQNQKFKVKIVSGAEDANNYQNNNNNNNSNNINNTNNNVNNTNNSTNNLKRKNEISLDNLAELVDSFEIFKTKKRLSL
jgi:fatty acid/phospholipid biosynthesis enzyme